MVKNVDIPMHTQPVKVSKIKKKLEEKINYFLENDIDTPYVEFLMEAIDNKNAKKLIVFNEILENMEEAGLGKSFFPLLYINTFSFFKDKYGLDPKSSILIGGWATFFYDLMNNGFDDAIRKFRGSHDDDEIVDNYFVGFIESLYKDKGLENLISSHLGEEKKSCYITDKAIQIEEIQKMIMNYNSLFAEKQLQEYLQKLGLKKLEIYDLDKEKLKEVGEKIFELRESLKKEENSYLRKLGEWFDKNIYLKTLIDLGKGKDYTPLDKLGRLELDLYIKGKDKVQVGKVVMDSQKVTEDAAVYNFGNNGEGIKVALIDPYHLTIMKLTAGRKKDINDLINLYKNIYELPEKLRKSYNLKSPEDYLKALPKEYKEKFLDLLSKNPLYQKKDKVITRIIENLKS
jgi:hypothetical protein